MGASSGAGSAPSPSGDLGDPWPGGPDSQCVRAMFLPTHHNAARAPAGEPEAPESCSPFHCRQQHSLCTHPGFPIVQTGSTSSKGQEIYLSLSPPADSPCVSAVYSLFVVGGSGVVTHHSLQPHPHEDAREGDDAHIALDCHSHLCWRLLRSACVCGGREREGFNFPFSLQQATSFYNETTLSRGKPSNYSQQ